jgi:hypothetical protein
MLTLLLSSAAFGATVPYQPERTLWGTPDIDGLWDFRTLTPFERPAEFGDRAVLTLDEAEVLRQAIIARQDVDQRSAEASVPL